MRLPRIKGEGAAYYHIMSRVIDGAFLLNDEEKERFCKLMRKAEAFSGVEILTHTTLDNHWHIHLLIPPPGELSDGEFLERVGHLYDPRVVSMLAAELKQLRTRGDEIGVDRLRARYTYRMHDVSEFVKTLKQRFTQSYNARHKRKGTLWEDRFKSLLIEEGTGTTLATIAAYIDLNCVRAGIVEDPKDYRFCGYAEALAGDESARRGIQRLMRIMGRKEDWSRAACAYREWLYVRGAQTGGSRRLGFSPEKVQQVIETGGTLSYAELGRCRVRYFTDGAVLGSKLYIQDVLNRHRHRFKVQRSLGAQQTRGLPLEDLHTLRRMLAQPVGIPNSS